jgi:acyl dehydratase
MTTVLHGVDQVVDAVGRHFGYSDWVLVDESRVAQFASATGDRAHGGVIAPENLTLSLSNFLLPQIVAVEGVSAGINYGAEQVRFPAPVWIGKRLRAGAELLRAEPIAGGVQTTMRITLEVEGEGTAAEPVCVIDSLSRFLV